MFAGPGALSLSAGVRIDNSARSVVDDAGNDNRMLLSAEDRISLGVSDYHAFVASAYYRLPAGQEAFLGFEGSMDVVFGAHLPDGITAPDKPGAILRAAISGGFHLNKQWTALAFVQLAKVPKIDAADLAAGNIALIPYEPAFTELVRQWLEARVMEDGSETTTLSGTPQGGVISPLLSNIYLDDLDGVEVTVRLTDRVVVAMTLRDNRTPAEQRTRGAAACSTKRGRTRHARHFAGTTGRPPAV